MTLTERNAIEAVHAARLAAVTLRNHLHNVDTWLNTAIAHAGNNKGGFSYDGWLEFHVGAAFEHLVAASKALDTAGATLFALHDERTAEVPTADAVQEALERMHSAPQFFTDEQLAAAVAIERGLGQ
jgi:hypothetical protein